MRCGLCSLQTLVEGPRLAHQLCPGSPCLLWDGASCLFFGNQPLPSLHLLLTCPSSDLSTVNAWSSFSDFAITLAFFPCYFLSEIQPHLCEILALVYPQLLFQILFVSGSPGRTARFAAAHSRPLWPSQGPVGILSAPPCPAGAHGKWCGGKWEWLVLSCLNLPAGICSLLQPSWVGIGAAESFNRTETRSVLCFWVLSLSEEFLSTFLGFWCQWAKSTRLIVEFYSQFFKLVLLLKAHLQSPGETNLL